MKHDLIKKIEELDKNFEISFNRYVSETQTKSNEYIELLGKNKKNTIDITTTIRKTKRLKAKIALLFLKMKQQKAECQDRNDKLDQEKNIIHNHYLSLRKKMMQFRDEEAKRLANLTMSSKECMDTLKDYQKLGERILKTAELCRKLETEREKVLPFYESQADGEEVQMPDTQIEKIEGMKKSAADGYNEFTLLDNFYKRFNKVLLDKIAIEKQKGKLD